MVNIHGSLIN